MSLSYNKSIQRFSLKKVRIKLQTRTHAQTHIYLSRISIRQILDKYRKCCVFKNLFAQSGIVSLDTIHFFHTFSVNPTCIIDIYSFQNLCHLIIIRKEGRKGEKVKEMLLRCWKILSWNGMENKSIGKRQSVRRMRTKSVLKMYGGKKKKKKKTAWHKSFFACATIRRYDATGARCNAIDIAVSRASCTHI